jgi:4-hydroxy-3-polyprenylbenzoate decarboxylase
MAYKDIREYLAAIEKKGLLKRITAEVNPDLEIAEITDRVSKMPGGGFALMFENVKGYQIPVVTNALGSMERISLALEVSEPDDIAKRLLEYLDLPTSVGSGDSSMFAKLKALPKLAEIGNFMPKLVKNGPCQDVVITEGFDLNNFPILKTWPLDGGKFITLPMVFSKDPETGARNCGMYRLHVYDGQTTGMHWHKLKDGAAHAEKLRKMNKNRIEVAVAIGSDPAVIYSSNAPLPPIVDEMILAGFLRNAPVELVKCKTVDIEVPANSEIVLEGYVDIDDLRMEGPFGDHTGFYSLADLYPTFHLTAITHRQDPIYMATLVGKPPQEDAYLGKVTERLFLPIIKLVQPEVVDYSMPPEGVFHNCVIVSIKKKYPFHAEKVMNALWGLGQMAPTKLFVIVDDDVDVHNYSEVAWKVFSNIDPERDVVFSRGPLDDLDHSSPIQFAGSKMGINATRKLPGEGHNREWPPDVEMSPEIKALVDRKWGEYGIK